MPSTTDIVIELYQASNEIATFSLLEPSAINRAGLISLSSAALPDSENMTRQLNKVADFLAAHVLMERRRNPKASYAGSRGARSLVVKLAQLSRTQSRSCDCRHLTAELVQKP
jgi:hypothetical protein